jgi:hypothetical protein
MVSLYNKSAPLGRLHLKALAVDKPIITSTPPIILIKNNLASLQNKRLRYQLVKNDSF